MIKGHLNLKELEAQHQQLHKTLFDNSQGLVEKVFTTIPTIDQIPVGYRARYVNGSSYRIYENINGVLYKHDLTKA